MSAHPAGVSDPFDLLPRAELSRRRARLLSRIRRKYDIVEESLAIGPLRLQFTRVKDADVVLDQVCEEEDELHLPYWAELWDSSIGVGHFLARDPNDILHLAGPLAGREVAAGLPRGPQAGRLNARTKRILDLGCGMGLAGTVAAAMGHHVLLGDIEPSALLFARLNTLPYSARAVVRKLNWQTDQLGEKFDLILGADVLYERAQWEYLEPFWRAHLAKDGAILLAEPGRQTGDMFGDWIVARGWTTELHEQRIPTRPRPIRLFQLTR